MAKVSTNVSIDAETKARAQELLATSDAPVSDVARQVGFTDLPFFFRLFRRHVGCSPTASRALSSGR